MKKILILLGVVLVILLGKEVYKGFLSTYSSTEATQQAKYKTTSDETKTFYAPITGIKFEYSGTWDDSGNAVDGPEPIIGQLIRLGDEKVFTNITHFSSKLYDNNINTFYAELKKADQFAPNFIEVSQENKFTTTSGKDALQYIVRYEENTTATVTVFSSEDGSEFYTLVHASPSAGFETLTKEFNQMINTFTTQK